MDSQRSVGRINCGGGSVLPSLLSRDKDQLLQIEFFFLLFQIRKTAADQFYITLVTYDDIIDAEVADDVISILSETAWSAGKKHDF